MSLIVGQLIYTSFPETGFGLVASEQVPISVQEAFIEDIVRPHWNERAPLAVGYRAAYLTQLSPEQTLFGWLYVKDGSDPDKRDPDGSDPDKSGTDESGTDEAESVPIPYFVGYFLTDPLNGEVLETLFNCLETGPLEAVQPENPPTTVATLTLPNTPDYQAASPGVRLPSSSHARCRLLLYKSVLLNFFVPIEPDSAPQSPSKPEMLPEILPDILAAGATLASDPLEPDLLESTVPGSRWASILAQGKTLSSLDRKEEPDIELSLSSSKSTMSSMFNPLTTKVALLIGVSECRSGFNPLPGVPQDLGAMKAVLEHPEIGGFTQIRTLLNPDPQEMSAAIDRLFSERSSDELALLYFSGYSSIVDVQNKFCLTTGITRRAENNRVLRSTVVTTDFLDDVMRASPSQQQVVILDCCMGYLEPNLDPDQLGSPVNLAHQLGGPHRTIMAASQFTYPPQVDKGGESLSSYTFYLVEGLYTGIADANEDGVISLQEWHQYAKRKVKEVSPALEPSLHGDRTGKNLIIAQAPLDDPSLHYRREVERLQTRGQILPAHRTVLDMLQQNLNLSLEWSNRIEAEVLQPHKEFFNKIHAYAIAFAQITHQGSVLTEQTYRQCRHSQQMLGLTDAETASVDAEIVQQMELIRSPKRVVRALHPAIPAQPLDLSPQIQNTFQENRSRFHRLFRRMTPHYYRCFNLLQRIGKTLSHPRAKGQFIRTQFNQRAVWMLVGGGVVASSFAIASIRHMSALQQNERQTEQQTERQIER